MVQQHASRAGNPVLSVAASIRNPFDQFCAVAPHPELQQRIRQELERLRGETEPLIGAILRAKETTRVGLNDGTILPGNYFPLGTPAAVVQRAAAERAPLRGTIRVIIVLVDFPDQPMANTVEHFRELFFSLGALPNGSVREYYRAVTNGLVDIDGQVVGPFTLTQPQAYYANSHSGMGEASPNARDMARAAAVAADPTVDFGPYDNDGNGFVDAFIVIHAGPGGEVTGNVNHIWSHKWVLAGNEYTTDSTKIFGYLTVPEDCRIGVCCHELGHLLFGWPDLYDTDNSSSGAGDWCLMAGGSWNGNGNVPAHPSAWCKASQGWVSIVDQQQSTMLSIADVTTQPVVYRLWKNGQPGTEYFLVENRQRTGYDAGLPGDGLLIWHIDETVGDNTNERHYKVALMQADGAAQLESGINRGDAGDPYPGASGNTTFDAASTPNSKSYGDMDSCVSLSNISASGAVMTATVGVTCPTAGGQPTVPELEARIAVLETQIRTLLASTGAVPQPHLP